MTNDESSSNESPKVSGGNYLLSTDGSGTGPFSDPSEGAIGVVLRNPRGFVVATLSRPIGPATNTTAEYRALIEGLRLALQRGVYRIRVFVDSELLVDQLQGRAEVRKDHIRPLHQEATDLLSSFSDCRISWIPRAWNTEADVLAAAALKGSDSFARESSSPQSSEQDGAQVIDAEGQAMWISEHTDLPQFVVERVLNLEFEFMVAAGIVDVPDYDFDYYSPEDLQDVGDIVDTQRLAQDAERFLNIPVEIAALIFDAENQYFRMRGLTD